MKRPGSHCFTFLFAAALLLSACQPALPTLAPTQAAETPLPAATNTPTPDPNIFEAAEVTAPPPVARRNNEPPVQFTFPTPEPAEDNNWRPPLYPAPWALGLHDHFYFTRAIGVDEVNWPLADYRYGDFFTGTDIIHTGIDIDATRGTPIMAAGNGKVVWAGYGFYRGDNDPDDPYGLAVAIRHDFGYQGKFLYTVYAHMDRVDVKIGQKVKTGDFLGIVGNTGNTTGPHLHFEVRIEANGFYVTRNPELWITPPQGWGVLVGRLTQWDGTPIRRADVTVRSLESKRVWMVRTYGPNSVNSDDYYNENLVLSDLPAGRYEISFDYHDVNFKTEIEIHPGAISYFTFRQYRGFKFDLPAEPADQEWLKPVDDGSS